MARRYENQDAAEKMAAVMALLAVAGSFDTQQDGINYIVDEFMTVLIALAYITNLTPREAADRAFKSAPSNELWVKMVKELEDTMDNLFR